MTFPLQKTIQELRMKKQRFNDNVAATVKKMQQQNYSKEKIQQIMEVNQKFLATYPNWKNETEKEVIEACKILISN